MRSSRSFNSRKPVFDDGYFSLNVLAGFLDLFDVAFEELLRNRSGVKREESDADDHDRCPHEAVHRRLGEQVAVADRRHDRDRPPDRVTESDLLGAMFGGVKRDRAGEHDCQGEESGKAQSLSCEEPPSIGPKRARRRRRRRRSARSDCRPGGITGGVSTVTITSRGGCEATANDWERPQA
jgi:hypothetical protein